MEGRDPHKIRREFRPHSEGSLSNAWKICRGIDADGALAVSCNCRPGRPFQEVPRGWVSQSVVHASTRRGPPHGSRCLVAACCIRLVCWSRRV